MIYIQAIVVLGGLGGTLAVLLLIADRFLANYGPCKVAINDRDPIEIEGGRKLLEVFYDNAIFIPSACGGQGTCGFCKITVKDGGGPVLPTELPYLTTEEVEAGTRLACQVKVREDVVVHVKEEYLNVKEFKAVISSARMITHDTRELRLKLTEGEEIDYRPGQYVQVFVPDTGETTFRAYSVASAPSSKTEIELLVRLVPGGLGSTYLHNIRVGDGITFTGAYGEFELDMSEDTELVCVGGGCGMAPMRSILRHIHEVAPTRTCRLFFGARTTDDIMYMNEFQALAGEMKAFGLHYALSEPAQSPGWDGETGFIHESVERHLGTEGRRQAFLCGPPQMVEATMRVLHDRGLTRDQIFYDEF
ncbi:MAG: 2Fe-2S iron-sulfur cluster binding domain-containing protein [Lentisphaerae bacterium]|jgi:Na+-transporting NADH:ubiquinone oxidoreductase subunit F|nr:2Fe-2S iron-sulfur cluster binding domain-containing protein [Lentisphaerota bacterium]MBT5607810.1 2Fe-2S iron-sulfur cluster binding domain-containing protein [Lentisphaerota bacterium]MBT7058720.1 2Fe-2S iron-sulfur cluster binding domain-containing protein [Lentisphaerota bacterium]MBT7847080.1 2Fe-2S iron-sulfur cluster binding domain-containing protein [Lentisphaerota bacterium]